MKSILNTALKAALPIRIVVTAFSFNLLVMGAQAADAPAANNPAAAVNSSALNVTAATANVDKNHVIIDGYDVVSYFNSAKPVKGSDQFSVDQNGIIYHFSSEVNKQTFLKDPKKYEPQYGGWCAYAVAEKKEKVEVDPESFLIQDGRLLLFFKAFYADTKKEWEKATGKGKVEYLKLADKNWPEVIHKKP